MKRRSSKQLYGWMIWTAKSCPGRHRGAGGGVKDPGLEPNPQAARGGVIQKQVMILDPEAIGLEACFFVLIRTSEHDKDWAARFLKALRDRPEVVEAHRLAGDIDYILKVQVKNARAYDRFYQSLISEVKIYNVTALLSMEEIKATTALPIPDATR